LKLSCLQENLNRGLNIVGRAVATRTTLPVTQNVLMITEAGRLKLVATDLEMAISTWIGAKIEEEGKITIPATLLTEFVHSLQNDKIDMTLLPKSKTMELKCARVSARISGVDAEEFPNVDLVEAGIPVSVSAQALHQAIHQVVFAAAHDESRPILTGIDAIFDGNSLTLAATDGFRLAIYKLVLEATVSEKVEAIIPARTIAELDRLLGDEKDDFSVSIHINRLKNQVFFRLSNTLIVSQLLQGNYPQYRQLVPSTVEAKATVEVAAFLRAVKTAAIFSNIIRLQVVPGDPGKMVISARSDDYGDNVGEIEAVVDKESKVAFDYKYLQEVLDVLDVLPWGKVTQEMNGSSNPAVLKPEGSDYLYVIMPMYVPDVRAMVTW